MKEVLNPKDFFEAAKRIAWRCCPKLSLEPYTENKAQEVALSKRRRRHEAEFRQRIAYALHSEGMTYTAIGRMLGGRDHSTIIHAVNQVQGLLSANICKDTKNFVRDWRKFQETGGASLLEDVLLSKKVYELLSEYPREQTKVLREVILAEEKYLKAQAEEKEAQAASQPQAVIKSCETARQLAEIGL